MKVSKQHAEAVVHWRVDIVEYERGWGSRVDEQVYFTDYQAAETYIQEYNLRYNNEVIVPDWYMVAQGPY